MASSFYPPTLDMGSAVKKTAIKRLRRRGLTNDLKARQTENKAPFNAMAQNNGPVETHKGSYPPKGR